jgi:putative ABC transport system permease protein
VAMSGKLAEVRNATWYVGIGRVKPGVTLEQARANLALVQAQLGERYPDPDGKIGVNVAPLKEVTIGGVRSSLWLLFGAVTVLLLITCTNIAALLLSRAAHRRQEIAIRASLGATRAAVAAQMLTETSVLAVAGGVMGVLVAAGASAAFRTVSTDLPRMDEIAVDGRILLYTLATSTAVALLCGLLPAIRTARADMAGAPTESGRTQVSTRNSLQWLLVGAQVALSVTLLAGAGLLVRSFHELSRVDPGFDTTRVLTFRVSGNWSETANYGRLIERIDGTLEAMRALPGVEAAATAVFLPGVPSQYESAFELVEAQRDSERRMISESRVVSPEYFATMQIPLMGGEPCRRAPAGGTREAMVNRTFATRYLSAWSSAAGLHLSPAGGTSRPQRIVGVVGDARERGLDRDSGPIVYSCTSAPNPMPYFLVRTRGESAAMARTVRMKIKELDPLRAVYDVAPLDDRIGETFTQNRVRTMLLVIFAATALSLACVGIYGTLSYTVSLRRREIGLRLALGAVRSDIVRHFLMQGLRVVVLATACGLALSMASARVLSGLLYGVSPSDPLTLSGVIGIVLVFSALAAFVPALRASQVEPRQVLHEGG